jgi:hypothetical protein
MDLLPNTGFSCCKLYRRSFGLQSKPHFKGLLRNPSFHTIDITHATIVILSFYSPYVNKPRDYFVRGSGFFTQPRYTGKVKPLSRKYPPSPAHLRWASYGAAGESTKTRKLEKENIKISCFRD